MAERVRLIIWDLDETFWRGTLTEGGIRLVPENRELVIHFAKRGIVSTICSKNDIDAVRDILVAAGLYDYFVLPSVSWEPKGPRVAALVDEFQLRPETVLFIDDNNLNLREVQHYTPGIQVADHTFIPSMAADPRFAGKDDGDLTRLRQYKVLERRKHDQKVAGSNVDAFLRKSGIVVSFEFDVGSEIDRAIELITRTNQLNFTKRRLSEDPDEAKVEFKKFLARHDIQCALLKVTDSYGDHGYTGLYAVRSGVELIHFCFSCRILGMGIESWLYNRLRRPALAIIGEVLSDPKGDSRTIDWVAVQQLGNAQPNKAAANTTQVGRIFARGGCDLQAVTHYFDLVAEEVVGEFNVGRSGFDARIDHSIFFELGQNRLGSEALAIAARLGYRTSDFDSAVFEGTSERFDAWLLSFWTDASYALYRHEKTGLPLPFAMPGQSNHRLDVRLLPIEQVPERFRKTWVATALETLKAEFAFAGVSTAALFQHNLRTVLSRKNPSTVAILLGPNDELWDSAQGVRHISDNNRALTTWMEEVAVEYDNVHVVKIRTFIRGDEEVHDWHHFDRMVYFRLFEYVRDMMPVVSRNLSATC